MEFTADTIVELLSHLIPFYFSIYTFSLFLVYFLSIFPKPHARPGARVLRTRFTPLVAGPASTSELDSKLRLIGETTEKLLQQERVTCEEWRQLFQTVQSICTWNEDEKLIYNTVDKVIKSVISTTKAKIEIHQEDETFVKAYVAEWQTFFENCGFVPMPFESLLVMKWEYNTNNFNVRKLMLESWNNDIFAQLAPRVHASAMNLVDAERNGKLCDPLLITNVRVSDIDVCIVAGDKHFHYRELFVKAYIDNTRTFYQKEAAEVAMANEIYDYMKYADRRLGEEIVRADKYLNSDWKSQTSLKELCADLLVVPVQDAILAECKGTIERNDIENLQRMFRLLNLTTDGVAPMSNELKNYIVTTCLEDMLVAAETVVENPEKYVQRLIDLFNHFGDLIKVVFQNDERFLASRDRAFKIIVNDTSIFKLELAVRNKTVAESKCPELLASYCDLLLRKTQFTKKLTSEDIDNRLKDVVTLLIFAENSDVFMIYYKSHLTTRLIMETSADLDKEQEMIAWIKNIGMPVEYISNVSLMLRDVQLSADFNRNFRQEHLNINTSLNIKIFNAGVLARLGNKIAVTLPVELEDYVSKIEIYYKNKHGGRTLIWDHQLSHGTITFFNAIGKFDVDVTTFQMAVLFAWNERPNDRISFEDLRLATELPEPQLKKTIWSLVATPFSRRSVVLCYPEVKSPSELKSYSHFWINDEFAVVKNGKVHKRGKVNLIGRLQLSTESNEVDNAEIVYLRKLRVQEAIVRVTKARMTIATDQLQTELIGILKNMFLPTKRMIKEQVEWLIENNHIGRDKFDLNVLVYIA